MQEIIVKLDEADKIIREELTDHGVGLRDARKKDILMQVRENVQKAITLMLSMPY